MDLAQAKALIEAVEETPTMQAKGLKVYTSVVIGTAKKVTWHMFLMTPEGEISSHTGMCPSFTEAYLKLVEMALLKPSDLKKRS